MDINKMYSPELGEKLWISPQESFSLNLESKKELQSTPDVSAWPGGLEISGNSSKQDSGYCSLTPSSAESVKEIYGKQCMVCSTFSQQHYAQSTPECNKACDKNHFYENHSNYLQTISENAMSSLRPFMSRNMPRRSIELDDEALDTSLYPSEMEVEDQISGDNCSAGLMDISEENSIDIFPSTPDDMVSKQIGNRKGTEHFFSSPLNFNKNYLCSASENDTFQPKCVTSNKFPDVVKNVKRMSYVVKTFRLNGIDQLDFLYQLNMKNHFPHIVSKIFSFLSEVDLDSVRVVSKTWNRIFHADTAAYNRWNLFKTKEKLMAENYTSPTKRRETGSSERLPFSPLHNLSNKMSSNESPRRNSPPVSPKTANRRSFWTVAKSLKGGERVLKCPKCSGATHDKGYPTAQCSRSICRHVFCVWCFGGVSSEIHHKCTRPYTPRRFSPLKISRVGSKEFKKRMHRL